MKRIYTKLLELEQLKRRFCRIFRISEDLNKIKSNKAILT